MPRSTRCPSSAPVEMKESSPLWGRAGRSGGASRFRPLCLGMVAQNKLLQLFHTILIRGKIEISKISSFDAKYRHPTAVLQY
jgi:hypothetical protein